MSTLAGGLRDALVTAFGLAQTGGFLSVLAGGVLWRRGRADFGAGVDEEFLGRCWWPHSSWRG